MSGTHAKQIVNVQLSYISIARFVEGGYPLLPIDPQVYIDPHWFS